MKHDLVSIILPVYNASTHLKSSLHSLLSQTYANIEIIVIDDNSKDGTPRIMDRLSKTGNFIALHRYGKKGLFSAVQDGIFIANGDCILTMDADFSHPPELIPELVKYADDYDAVVASRYTTGGGMNAPFIRFYGSRILNWLCVFIAGLEVSDFGGQFRLFKKNKYSQLIFQYPSRFGEYGIELFYRAKKLKFKIKEIPFTYQFRERGKSKMGSMVKLPQLGLKYLLMALKLRVEPFLKFKHQNSNSL